MFNYSKIERLIEKQNEMIKESQEVFLREIRFLKNDLFELKDNLSKEQQKNAELEEKNQRFTLKLSQQKELLDSYAGQINAKDTLIQSLQQEVVIREQWLTKADINQQATFQVAANNYNMVKNLTNETQLGLQTQILQERKKEEQRRENSKARTQQEKEVCNNIPDEEIIDIEALRASKKFKIHN